jgi:hypothetical protein
MKPLEDYIYFENITENKSIPEKYKLVSSITKYKND